MAAMDINNPGELGQLLRKHRMAMGLTQRDAAGLCGVGERYLSELERGKPTASLGKALQVMRRLGLKIHISSHLLPEQ